MPLKKKSDRKKENSNEVKAPKIKRFCLYCENKTEPSYQDTATLRRFVSDRSKILPRARSGACSKHQRQIARQIKYARHLSLLPFVASI